MVKGQKRSIFFPDFVWTRIEARYEGEGCKSPDQWVAMVTTREALKDGT